LEFEPHITVATVVERDGRFLLVEEWAEGRLVYNQPAGHLDANETLQAAAIRETLEETAWEVELRGVVGLALYTAPANGITYMRTTFAATALQHLDRALDTDIERALWLSYEEMLASSAKMRSPLVITTVEQYLAGNCYPLDLMY
jgi:ADP-ribose pyrophosphatase YjhB (NUDIX family)